MHAIIHIGTLKTGTTSVQRFLHLNRALFAAQGCLYPQSLYNSLLSESRDLRDHNQLSLHLANACPGDFLTPLRSELEASGCGRLLISSEGLSVHLKHRQQLERLQAFLQELGCDEITIVVWLRESGAMFTSLCSEELRYGRPEYMHLLTPRSNPHHRSILDYRALLQRWLEVFGRQALQVRLFEQECFADGDLLHDALAAFGLHWDERLIIPARSNASLNLLEMEILRVINHLQEGTAFMGDSPKVRLFETVHRHCGKLQSPALHFEPPPQIVQAWREWAAEGNEWVRAEFFPERSALFTLPPPQPANYELTQMTPACWEALGRVLTELSEENFQRHQGMRRP